MSIITDNLLSPRQLLVLSSIVQVGDSSYRDILQDPKHHLNHSFLKDTRGRLRTKFVQMQCELESHSPDFPFEFFERKLKYGHAIPELQTDNLILHIARSHNPEILPPAANYKIDLSNRNSQTHRQLIMDDFLTPPCRDDRIYGIVVFGGTDTPFAVIQIPEPGYKKISDTILIPMMTTFESPLAKDTFERKKAILKQQFIPREEVIS